MAYTIHMNGENSVCVTFEHNDTKIDRQAYIYFVVEQLSQQLNGLNDIIPATESITLTFNESFSEQALEQLLSNYSAEFQQHPQLQSKTHIIEVCYDCRVAPDLLAAAKHLNMSHDELIQAHKTTVYRLDMLGFLPGFLYLSGLPDNLHIPRKTTPAISVPSGSVAIAGNQSGLYSLSSPGGWWVIGRTADTLFDPQQDPPIKIKPMERVEFRQISFEQWQTNNDH